MADLPNIAGTAGTWCELKAGTHRWCACGLSRSQPLCDGAHRGTGMEPVAFVLQAPARVILCLCKHTRNPPYCDGSHASVAPTHAFDEYL